MFHVVLVNPEIPPNAGNVIRLCANTGSSLHLVEPLGFSMDDRQLKRAGLDYHEMACVRVHSGWTACREVLGRRRFAFTTRALATHAQTRFEPGDALVFGPEAAGLDDEFLSEFPPEMQVRIPMIPGNRSLNLSNAVAVAVYEAWRQQGFARA